MELVIENLSKSYGSNLALSSFSASFHPGIYALLGPNGSGKSTLMNIITGNLKADSGRVLYDGEDTVKMGGEFRAKLGFMPQYPGLYPSFTVEEMMWYAAALKDVGVELKHAERKKLIRGKVKEILDAVELSDVSSRRIGALSGGMKQRLALAQAVLGDPSVLILDEPTAGLDPKQRISIRNYISKISFDKIVIIATHVVSDVEYIARNAILLKKGVIIENGSPQELTEKIRGKVWGVWVEEDGVAEMQSRYRVTNIAHDESNGKVSLRIISDTMPERSAAPVNPSLEDYYLYTFEDAEN